MTVDSTKLAFSSDYLVDKIIYESDTTSNTYSGGGAVTPDAHNFSVAHTVGESVIVNGMFSIDGTNFYPCGTSITGAIGGSGFPQHLECDMYANADSVFVYISNGYDATQTVHIYYVLELLS